MNAEFDGIDLDDARRDRRVRSYAACRAARPMSSIPQACGTWAATKAAYRLMSNPDVTPTKILAPHVEQLLERARDLKMVLAIGDTTTLDFSTRHEMEGIGPLGGSNRGPGGLGMMLQATVVATPEGKLLGVADLDAWARDKEDFGNAAERCKRKPIESKESAKWLRSLAVAQDLATRLGPEVQVVSVFDREGDVYSVLHEAQSQGLDFVVRALHNRKISDDPDFSRLWDLVATKPVGTMRLKINRGKKRSARIATLRICASEVTIKTPPKRPKGESRTGDLKLFAVMATEVPAEDGGRIQGTPVQWKILTSLPVHTKEDAERILELYAARWAIEELFRVLKSGCAVEDHQFSTVDRFLKCLAVDAVVAWSVLFLMMEGRESPEVPCTVLFATHQWQAAWAYVNQDPEPPDKPPTLGEMVRLIGRLGGHLGRRHDGPPGQQTLWRGLQRLMDLAEMWLMLKGLASPPGTQTS